MTYERNVHCRSTYAISIISTHAESHHPCELNKLGYVKTIDESCDHTTSLLHARADDVKKSQTGHVLVVDALQHAVAVDVTRFRYVIRRATRRVILAVCQSTSSHDVTCKATLILACTNNDGIFAYEHVV